MIATLPTCPRCRGMLPGTMVNTGALADCPNCGRALDLRVFPAQFRRDQGGSTGEVIMVDGEASCFYHPQKRAALPCDSCGRFLCSLCDVDLNDKHFCPSCIDSGQKKGKLAQLENKRVLWDSAALGLAVIPIIVWFITLITAPAAIILGVIAWKKPSSVVPRTRIRIYLAFLVAAAQITAWLVLGWHLYQKAKS
jgi:hypothetical protein